MVIFVAVYCSIFGFSKKKEHTPTHYPAMRVFCGETSGQVSLTGQAPLHVHGDPTRSARPHQT